MILILSAEPYVPWELAVVDPPLDSSAPPFLSAQANVGRWVLGQRRPKLPPPSALSVRALAVVSGIYDLPGWERLVEAEAEAGDIVDAYGAAAVNATLENVLDLLRGSPAADLIHFAVHGSLDGHAGAEGLILVDGNALDSLAVRGTPMSGTPFVFLNACQVGRGEQLLGDHAGMAAAFLFAGAAGVVAPLWSIDDRLARQIARRFYERALDGDTAANVLRTERADFRDSPESVSSTYLAYQYFGHPALRLERAGGSPAGSPPPGSVVAPDPG
jgi:CHAT domain-containing protein